MSKAKDQARARSGRIFRNGKYYEIEEWQRLNPTKAVVQETVDLAVTDQLPYTCSKCSRVHKAGTKVHEEHKLFKT